jgi:hypothetical protein
MLIATIIVSDSFYHMTYLFQIIRLQLFKFFIYYKTLSKEQMCRYITLYITRVHKEIRYGDVTKKTKEVMWKNNKKNYSRYFIVTLACTINICKCFDIGWILYDTCNCYKHVQSQGLDTVYIHVYILHILYIHILYIQLFFVLIFRITFYTIPTMCRIPVCSMRMCLFFVL